MTGRTPKARRLGVPQTSGRDEWTKQAYQMLSDGKWHDREQMIQKVMPLIPAEVAWRRAEKERIKAVELKMRKELSPEEFAEWMADPANTQRRRPGIKAELNSIVRVGRRAIARDLLGGRAQNRIDRREHNGRVQIRLRPESTRYANSLARQVRERWLAEHPGEEVDELAITRAVYRARARLERERKNAQGMRRRRNGRWVPKENK